MILPLDTAQDTGASALRGLPGVVLPGDAEYDHRRMPWNRAVDQRPAGIAHPASVQDVQAIVRRAVDAGLRIATQTTGHNAGPLAARGLDDVLLLRTSALQAVSVDPARRTARVGGGTLWLPAVTAATAHGLTALHGSSPDVGIAGYSLGGGMGWYARLLGLAASSVTAVELVTADGALVRADAGTDAELFWALRGGGAGSFGVVTALEFALHPIRTAYAGMLGWDITRAENVLRRWASWAVAAPDEVTTSFRVIRFPPVPEVPEPFRGRALALIDGAVLREDDGAAAAVIAELRALAPEIDTFARVGAASLVRLHMDPEGGAAGVSDSAMLTALPDAGIEAFLEQVGPGVDTPLAMAEIRQLGGALGRPHDGGGVLDRLDGQFLAFCGAMAFNPEMAATGLRAARSFVSALSPWADGRPYLNFVENPIDAAAAFEGDSWRRLRSVRSVVDPDGVFLANHDVPSRGRRHPSR